MALFIGMETARPLALCVAYPSLGDYLAGKDITLVFQGRAKEIRSTAGGQVVTFEVIRVWKGDPHRTQPVYSGLVYENRPFEDSREFVSGEEYFVVTFEPEGDLADRIQMPTGMKEAASCSSSPFSDPYVQKLLRGHSGRKPR